MGWGDGGGAGCGPPQQPSSGDAGHHERHQQDGDEPDEDHGLAAAFPHQGGEGGEHRVEVPDDAEVGDPEDRRVRVLVHGDDRPARLHPGAVLDRPGDAGGEVELRGDRLAGLPDLEVVRRPSGVGDAAGRADRGPQGVREVLDDREAVLRPDPAPAGDDDVGAARGQGVVLADASLQGAPPQVWAARAVELAESLGAQSIVAEANQGGDMVRAVLNAAAPDMHVRLVHASNGKRARAEPIAALYAQGRVRHAAAFPALEDEMCAFGADGFKQSPDRVDALVWALTDLVLGGSGPRMRLL